MYISQNSARLLMQSTLLCGCAVFCVFGPWTYIQYIIHIYIIHILRKCMNNIYIYMYIYIFDICIDLYLHTHSYM